jgi:hypothetical protein
VFAYPASLKSFKFFLDQTFTALFVFQNNGFKWPSVTLKFYSKQSPEIFPSDIDRIETIATARPFGTFESKPIRRKQRDYDLTITLSEKMTVEFKLNFS